MLVLVVGLTLMGPTASALQPCSAVNLVDTGGQAIAIALVTYVTYITRRLDKEVKNGGE